MLFHLAFYFNEKQFKVLLKFSENRAYFTTSSFAIKKAGVTLTTNYKSGMQDTTLWFK